MGVRVSEYLARELEYPYSAARPFGCSIRPSLPFKSLYSATQVNEMLVSSLFAAYAPALRLQDLERSAGPKQKNLLLSENSREIARYMKRSLELGYSLHTYNIMYHEPGS